MSLSQDFPLVVIGGNSFVGSYLIQRLCARGMVADIISRRKMDVPAGFTLSEMDLTMARNWIAPENAVIVSLLPLWVLARFLPRFIGVKAIIAVGSTSVFSKARSGNDAEREVARSLENAENALKTWCERSNVTYTLLRPTMVYDGVHDKNIAAMIKFIRRFRFLPLAAPAKGLRQPIHADDVAQAIIGAFNNIAANNEAFNIAGGEALTYRAMVERVFAAQKIKPRLLMMPTEWLAKAFHYASEFGVIGEQAFGSSIFQRMNEDLVFDFTEGLAVLNYHPRNFEPPGE